MAKKILLILFLLFLTTLFAAYFFLGDSFSLGNEVIVVTAISGITLFAESVLTFYFSAKEREESKLFYDSLRGSMRLEKRKPLSPNEFEVGLRPASESASTGSSTDILELMLANMKEIRDYYVLSKAQARNAFSLAVVMCIVGFLLMAVSVAAAFLNSDNLVSSIVPAVGSVVVEVIAGTSLFVYNRSLNQLNHYYNSLHNNERFLSIVNIVSKISIEKQDDVYIEIIKSQIEMVSKDKLDSIN